MAEANAEGRTEYVVLIQREMPIRPEDPETPTVSVWEELKPSFKANSPEDAAEAFIEKAPESDKDKPLRAIAKRYWGEPLEQEVETVRRWKRK